MKNIFFLLSFFLFSITINAQEENVQEESTNESLQTFTDLATAKTYATEKEMDILMVFAGSDWCKPCKQFKKEILENNTFQDWAKDNLVVLYLDFPSRKKNKLSKEQTKYNEALAERFNKSGTFPNVLLLDINEEIVVNPKFKNQGVDEFIGALSED